MYLRFEMSAYSSYLSELLKSTDRFQRSIVVALLD